MAMNEKRERNSSRLGYMILSLIIAIIMWVFVAYTGNGVQITRKIHGINITFAGNSTLKERGLIARRMPGMSDYYVKLRGNRGAMIEAINKITATVDVSGVTEAGTVELAPVLRSFPDLTQTSNFSTVPVVIEEYETKEIPVEVRQTGTEKYKPVKSTPERETITVGGAKSEVDTVERAYLTVDVSLEDAAAEIELTDYDGALITKYETLELPGTENPEDCTQSMAVHNTVYDYAELPVKPALSEGMTETLDENATKVNPETVKIGVLPGYSFNEVRAVIEQYTTEETTCSLIEEEGMYIPKSEKQVSVTPVYAK